MPKLNVVKIGGGIIERPLELELFLKDFAAMEGPKILVHGGGRKATQWAEKMEIPVQMHQGRRITDEATLPLIVAVYAGLINKTIVSQLQAFNCNAIGLSGADGNSISAKKRPINPIDFGWVGDIEKVNPQIFNDLIEKGYAPVCCALSHDNNGQLLNTNADTIAAEIAKAMSADFTSILNFCFELNGVLRDIKDPSSVIEKITPALLKELTEKEIISEGMLPKLHNAFAAIAQGVSEVAIGSTKMINTNVPYTSIKQQ